MALGGLFNSEDWLGDASMSGGTDGGSASMSFGFDANRPPVFTFSSTTVTSTSVPPPGESILSWEIDAIPFQQPPSSAYSPLPLNSSSPSFDFPPSQPTSAYSLTPNPLVPIKPSSIGLRGFSMSPSGEDATLSLELRSHLLQLFFERRRQFHLVLDCERFLA